MLELCDYSQVFGDYKTLLKILLSKNVIKGKYEVGQVWVLFEKIGK